MHFEQVIDEKSIVHLAKAGVLTVVSVKIGGE
jgi:hypothetical protein